MQKIVSKIAVLLIGLLLVPSAAAQQASQVMATSDGTVISVETAGDVQELARYGRGVFDSVAWSPDDSILVVGGAAGLWFYDVADLAAPITPLTQHRGIVHDIDFSADGSRMVSVDGSGRAIVWDMNALEPFSVTETRRTLFDVAMSTDGSVIALQTGRSTFSLLDAQSGEALVDIEFDSGNGLIVPITFTDEDSLLVGYSRTANLEVWDVLAGSVEQTITIEEGNGTADHVVRDDVLFQLDTRAGFRVISLGTGEVLYRQEEDLNRPSEIAAAPDGATVVVGTNDEIRLYDGTDGTLITVLSERFRTSMDFVVDMAFNSDGSVLAMLLGDATVNIWDGAALREVEAPEGEASLFTVREEGDALLASVAYHNDALNALALSPDDSTLVTTDEVNTVTVWDVADGSLITQHPEAAIRRVTPRNNLVSFAPDGSFYAVQNGVEMNLYDAASHELLHNVRVDTNITNLLITADSRLIITGQEEGYVTFYDVEAGERLVQLRPVTEEITGLQLNAAGTLLAVGSQDGTVRLLGITGEE